MATLTNYSFRVAVAGKNPVVVGSKRLTIMNVIQFFRGIGTGERVGAGSTVLIAETSSVAASGTITLSSGSGTITATINGTGVPITWATDDTTSAALLAAAINASATALVSGHVTATSALGVVTVVSKFPGVYGNATTLAASGTGATASGARLVGGTATSTTFHY